MKLPVNEGPVDRLIRIVLGLGLFALATSGWVPVPALYLVLIGGSIGLVTGATGFCPTYALLGISTVPKHADEASTEA